MKYLSAGLICFLIIPSFNYAGPNENLIKAISDQDPEGVQAALQQGADPNTQDGSYSMLFNASSGIQADIKIVKLLLKANANPNIRNTYGGHTALMANQSPFPIFKLLIESKADVNMKSDTGENVLHDLLSVESFKRKGGNAFVGLYEDLSSVNKKAALLIKASIDVNATDNKGNSLLELAKSNKYLEIEKMLIKAGAKK